MPTKDTALDSVLENLLFTSADAKYKALVAVSHGCPLLERLSHYNAPEEMSALEGEIFGIDTDLFPALGWAYERYLNLVGIVDVCFHEFTNQEREDHAQYYDDGCWCFGKAVGFMVNVCNLPAGASAGWVCKIVAAETRYGLWDPE